MKVGMLILIENDLEKAIEFYKTMGLKLNFQVKDKWAELELSGTRIGLVPTTQTLPDRRSGIVIEVKDLSQTYKDLKNKGLEFLNEPTTAVHGLMTSIKDPGGNILDFYQPTPEKVKVKESRS